MSKFVYTKRAQADGVGKVGAEIKKNLHPIAYLKAHGYCEDAPDDTAGAQSAAMASPEPVGRRRGRA